jgi:hypothetical protein
MEQVRFAKTASRGVLGTVNDYAIAVTWASTIGTRQCFVTQRPGSSLPPDATVSTTTNATSGRLPQRLAYESRDVSNLMARHVRLDLAPLAPKRYLNSFWAK